MLTQLIFWLKLKVVPKNSIKTRISILGIALKFYVKIATKFGLWVELS
jgi:hypothetical protein